MDGPEWLRGQLGAFPCPACGQAYGASEMRLLAERDGLFFVDMECRICGSRTVAIVTVEAEGASGSSGQAGGLAHTDRSTELPAHPEHPPADGLPISADDVLEMHEFLATFHGDARQLLQAAARPLPRGAQRG